MHPRPAFTLLELALVLGIAGILLGLATPALHHARDLFAARAARDYVLTQLAYARVLAPAHGGAELWLDTAGAQLVVRAGAREYERTSLHERYGVTLSLTGHVAGGVAVRFDAIGLGRMSSRTLSLARGRAQAHLSISAYGRARPW